MAEFWYRGYSLNIRSEIALAGILPDAVRLSPGEGRRNAAGRERLLALLRQWGNNARIRDFLDLEFMAEMIRSAADPAAPGDPEAIDLTAAFQIAGLLAALEDRPVDEALVDEVGE